MKKHFKIVLALLLFSCILICEVKPVRAQAIQNVVDTYYNWLVDLNYKKVHNANLRLKKQYNGIRNFIEVATKIFTGDPYYGTGGSHGGGGHTRDTAEEITVAPVSTPQPIYNNSTNKVYNPVTNNYEVYEYYIDDSSDDDSFSFVTENNFITYEYNYTFFDIVVSPKESPTEGKFFKVYYELPDGRSSYNLTPNDINGVIFNYDVINYERTVTDSDVLGIWHLDGDYVNTVTSVNSENQWNNNFIDGRFGGCILRDGSYTFNSNPSSQYKNYNNIYLYTSQIPQPSEWTLEFWVWVPDPSTTLWQDSSGNYHRSKPDIMIFDSAPSWVSVAVQSDGTYYVNGRRINGTPFWNTTGARGSTGWPEKFLSVVYTGSYVSICFAFTDASVNVVENGVNYIYNTMATFAIDEVKFTKRILYTSYQYDVRLEPYDLSFAYTVPTLTRDYSTIAIQSPVNVHDTQIGGVRSSSPSSGDVFISLYDGRATSVSQYYNGIWNTVNGAVYLGGEWHNLLQYDFNTMMLTPSDNANTGATYIVNYYYSDGDNYVDVSGDDITFTIDTTQANPQAVLKILAWIPLLFGSVGTILAALCPFFPVWLTGLIGLCLGAVLTLILFVFIRRK